MIGAESESIPTAGLIAFVAVVEAGSFTRAARLSGVDKTVLSRRVKALEEELEVRLLQRTTRSVSVSDEGRALYDRVAPLLRELKTVIAKPAPAVVEGLVRVASYPHLAESLWVPVIARLQAEYPALHMELRASERMVNLIEGGFDLAVRAGNLPSSSLVQKRVATWRYVLVASPDWVRRHRGVKKPEDLAAHWLLYVGVPRAPHWRFERIGTSARTPSRVVNLRVKPLMSSDNGHVLHAAAVGGVGVTAMAPTLVENDLARGTLVRLLPRWRVAHTHGIFTVMPHRAHVPPRTRVLLDLVTEQARALEARWRSLSE